ncbi:HEPN domain-containing protein [Thermodesulfatator atlanticus]|nr:hypothetical protein [Thermodesulfatator atlanticus]
MPLRYPNGPDLTPDEVYTRSEAEKALEIAEEFLPVRKVFSKIFE